jgi:tetratricopeptide (TPR) repeat protein
MRASLCLHLGGACLAIATAVIAPSAAAPTDQQSAHCINDDNRYPPDVAIKACSAILESLKSRRIAADRKLELEAGTLKYRALAYGAKNDYDHAIADYTQAIADYMAIKGPNVVSGHEVAGAFSVRGAAYFEMKDYDRAIDDETQAIKLDPANAAIYYFERGAVYFQKSVAFHQSFYLDLDIADETQAIRLDPDTGQFYAMRAVAYREKGETDEALKDFDRAIALSPKNVLFLSQRARTYLQKSDYDRAIADYTAAIALEPKNADLWVDRCDAKVSKSHADALSDCDQAIRLDPNNAYAFSVRGLIKLLLGDQAGSAADYARAKALDARSSK